MSMNIGVNFMPAVKCPYCGKTNHPAISGWGGQFNTRTKYCRHCGEPYTFVVCADATTEPDISLAIATLGIKIDYLRQRTYECKNNLSNKYSDWAEEFLRVESGSRGKQN